MTNAHLKTAFWCLLWIGTLAWGTNLPAQALSPYQKLQTRMGQFVCDTLSAPNLSLYLAGAPPKHGSVQISMLQSGGNNQPFVYEIRYTPQAQFVGMDTFTLELNFNSHFPYLLNRGLVVAVAPSSLRAADDYAMTAAGQTIALSVLDNDVSSHPPLSLQGVALSNYGTAEVQGNQVLFTPHPGARGAAFFTYTVCDQAGHCAPGAAFIWIHEGGEPQNDTLRISMKSGIAYTAPLSHLGYALDQQPAYGTAQVVEQGRAVRYTPAPGFVGSDAFRLIWQQNGVTAYKTVLVQVYAPPPPPNRMAVNDVVYTPRNTPVSFNVRSNDIGSLTVRQWIAPSNLQGVLSGQSGSGQVTFTPKAGFTGATTFHYWLGNQFQAMVEMASVTVMVHDAGPTQSEFALSTPLNTPMIVRYPAPFLQYTLQVTQAPASGQCVYYPGYSEQTIQGQTISGYNLLVYTPNAGFEGDDAFTVNYCAGPQGQCYEATMQVAVTPIDGDAPPFCLADCAWLGDADYDGVVQAEDLLTMARYMGYRGPEQAIPPGDAWYGRHADPWNQAYLGHTTDLKHLDADGDGMIAAADTALIALHYGRMHQPQATVLTLGKGLPMLFQTNNPNPQINDTVQVWVRLGVPTQPIVDLSGFTLRFKVAPEIVVSDLRLEYLTNTWLTRAAPHAYFQKALPNNTLEAAFSYVNGYHGHGEGMIAVLSFVIIDIVDIARPPEQYANLALLQVESAAAYGEGPLLRAPDQDVFLPINIQQFISSTVEAAPWSCKVYPNPVSGGQFYVAFDREVSLERAIAYDVNGREMWRSGPQRIQRLSLDASRWPSGMYLLHLVGPDGVLTRQVVVAPH